MGLDIRFPIGVMFTLIGVLLVIFGVATGGNAEIYRRSLGINMNFWWGLLLLAFGLFMLIMGWRAAKRPPSDAQAPKKDAGR